jgi:selenocysteine-specific elongation factor
MDRLVELVSVPSPPPFAEAVRAAGCPPDGVRALEASGRLVRLEADLAWSAETYAELEATAVDLAGRAPLTPATLRDAIGASRRYVMPILEDLDRRQVLRRTPAGHVPGPRAAARTPAGG